MNPITNYVFNFTLMKALRSFLRLLHGTSEYAMRVLQQPLRSGVSNFVRDELLLRRVLERDELPALRPELCHVFRTDQPAMQHLPDQLYDTAQRSVHLLSGTVQRLQRSLSGNLFL